MLERKCVKSYRPLQQLNGITRFTHVENQSRNHALRKRTHCCYISLCRHVLFGLDAYDKTKDTLGTVFYSSGSILVPRYIVAKAKFV